jgi:hypothetical protein
MARAAINRRRARASLLLGVGLLMSACASTIALQQTEEFTPRSATPRVLLMPADIELSELSAGGIPFPKAEWTTAAMGHVSVALDEFLSARSATMVTYVAPPEFSPEAHRQGQLIKLHGAVGNAVLAHKFNPAITLPTVRDKFDYTLGGGVGALAGGVGDSRGADYALFVYIRDSYASGERAAVIMFGLLLGVAIPGGVQVGFASLVDLQSGDVVWFNRLLSAGGDLRKPDLARSAAADLLSKLPL